MFGLILALLFTAGWAYLLKKPAVYLGLVDQPDHRKIHRYPTPKIGGLAMLLAIGMLAPWFFTWHNPQDLGILAAAIIFFLIGFQSDRSEWPAAIRYCAQLGFTVIIAESANLAITHVGNLLGVGVIELGIWSLPFTAFCVVSLVNGFNLMDGADGVLSLVTLPMLGGLVIAAECSGQHRMACWLLVIIGAVLGFALLNVRFPGRLRAPVFLGDGGSLMLGAIITFSLVVLAQRSNAFLRPIDTVWIAGLPILDTVNVTLGRWRNKRSIFTPGNDHIHHRLLALNWTHGMVSVSMGGISAALVAVGLAAAWWQWPEILMGGLIVFVAACYFRISSK